MVVLDLHWLPVVCWNVKINKDTIPYNYPEFCIAFMHAQVLQVDCVPLIHHMNVNFLRKLKLDPLKKVDMKEDHCFKIRNWEIL